MATNRKNAVFYQKARRKLLKINRSCCYCGCKLSNRTATLEHIIPVQRGGPNHIDNLDVACENCNTKYGKLYELCDWMYFAMVHGFTIRNSTLGKLRRTYNYCIENQARVQNPILINFPMELLQ